MRKSRIACVVLMVLVGLNNMVQSQDLVDATTLNNKIMAGYQGWFNAPGDGNDYGWIHWSRSGQTPNPDNITFDMWPDIREYDADELYPTSFVYEDGTNAGLFSSYNTKTVNRHVKWMKDYGIDGVFVQRFISSALSRRDQRDQVLQNVRLGAEAHGRVFANMYDMSGGKPESFVQDVINDWKHLVDDLKILESPNYLHHKGKPVLSLWGVNVGGSRGILTAAHWQELVTWFTVTAPEKYRVTLKAGVGNGWRGDSNDWQAVYDAFDIISPWSVGRYRDNNTADTYRDTYFQADLDETASRDMQYMPVVFPGFSWMNLKGDGNILNSIPRNKGEFLWHQMYNAIDAGCNMVYVAMFDEVDEGTAIFKTTENASQTPTTGTFLTLDADGLDLPSDWYLRLTGEATKMLRGNKPLTSEIPISPYPNTAYFISQNLTTMLDPGTTETVSITMKNKGTTTWTKAEGYRLGSVDPEDNMTWGLNRVELEDGDAIAPGESKIFTFDITAPTEKNIYRFQWKMIQEGEAFFGEKTKNRLINVGSPSFFLDDCDALTAWSSSGSLSLNNTEKKQGANCLEFNGGNTDEFRKVFSSPYISGIKSNDAVLQFWYFTSDASKMGSSNQVEIGSGGTHDVNEYSWSLNNLSTGWNLITLKISDASMSGIPDLNAINWFRLYNNKSGTIITRIDEIQILDYNATVPKYALTVHSGTGDGNYVENEKVDISADMARDGYIFKEWTIDSGIAEIADLRSANTTITILSSDVEISATYKLIGQYLDDCDAMSGWKSSSSIALNNTDNKEGENCIEFNGNGTNEFNKSFSSSYNSGVSASNAVLQFWYYISDVTKMGTSNQVELGSGGKNDIDEYNWNLSGLKNGWNLINLKVSNAGKNGNPNIYAINWFRYYNSKSGSITSRIDAIEIIDPNAGEKYILSVNNGSGTGAYYSNTTISITAEAAPEAYLFDTWAISSGSPSIANLKSANTTLTMSAGEAEVTATYKLITGLSTPYSVDKQSVNIYPNPLSGDLLSVDLLGYDKNISVDVMIINMLGQAVYMNTIKNADHLEIDASGFNKKSIYLVMVKSGQSVSTRKLIIE